VFVDVIPVSAVLYIINFANCYQNGPQTARKEAKEGREGKESNHNRKEKEIVQTYESGVRVTDLTNMYSMSKSTILTILQRKDLYKEASVVKGVTLPRTERTPESQLLFLVGFLWEFRNAL